MPYDEVTALAFLNLLLRMAFRCGQNYTDSKNMLKT